VPDVRSAAGVPEQFDEHIKLHYDLLALAFKADITRWRRCSARAISPGASTPFPKGPLFPKAARASASTAASHHQDDPAQISRYALINRYHVSTLATSRRSCARFRKATATCSDHSLILYGTNMGNSNQHQHYDVPHILVGGAGGKLKGNRHLALRAEERDDRQPAAQPPRYVRHREGDRRRQHRTASRNCRAGFSRPNG
jgi:hypothetical protein